MEKIKFHLAIPSQDILASMKFYSSLGCKIGRFGEKFCIVDFFGCQLVCHLNKDVFESDDIYPRHFGLVLGEEEFMYIKESIIKTKIPFFKGPFSRHENELSEHITFFIKDPSNNMIEFKTYEDSRMI